jgi:hypothetical protein
MATPEEYLRRAWSREASRLGDFGLRPTLPTGRQVLPAPCPPGPRLMTPRGPEANLADIHAQAPHACPRPESGHGPSRAIPGPRVAPPPKCDAPEDEAGGKRVSPPTLPSPTPIRESTGLAALENSQGGGEIPSGGTPDPGESKGHTGNTAGLCGEEKLAAQALGGHGAGMTRRPPGYRRQPELLAQ